MKSDIELWNEYKGGNKAAKNELIDRYLPRIKAQVRLRFGGGTTVPISAVESEGIMQVSNAIDNFNPSKGASLSTHIFNYLQKVSRFHNTYAFSVRSSEEVFGHVSPIMGAHSELSERLGRDPSNLEIAEHLHMDEKVVARVRNQAKDIKTQIDFDLKGTSTVMDDYIDFVRKFDLTPQEQIVFDHTTGYLGAKKKKAGDIAKSLNVSPAQISHIKNKISKKFEDAMWTPEVMRS